MAKQYQSIGAVVNEPATQLEYQTTYAVVQTEETAGPAVVAPRLNRLPLLGVH